MAHPYNVSEQQCSIHVSAELSYSIRVGIVFVSLTCVQEDPSQWNKLVRKCVSTGEVEALDDAL